MINKSSYRSQSIISKTIGCVSHALHFLQDFCKKLIPFEHTTSGILLLVAGLALKYPPLHFTHPDGRLQVFLGELAEIAELACFSLSPALFLLGIFVKVFDRLNDLSNWRLDRILEKILREGSRTYQFRPIDAECLDKELALVTRLGNEAYGFKKRWNMRYATYKAWFQANQNNLRVITCNDEIVGFVCILPLLTGDNHSGEDHYKGYISEFAITGNMISPDTSNLLLVNAIYIDSDHHSNPEAIRTLLDCYEFLVAHHIEDHSKAIVYAEPTRVYSHRIYQRLGFKSVKTENAKRKIYQRKLADPDMNSVDVSLKIQELFRGRNKR